MGIFKRTFGPASGATPLAGTRILFKIPTDLHVEHILLEGNIQNSEYFYLKLSCKNHRRGFSKVVHAPAAPSAPSGLWRVYGSCLHVTGRSRKCRACSQPEAEAKQLEITIVTPECDETPFVHFHSCFITPASLKPATHQVRLHIRVHEDSALKRVDVGLKDAQGRALAKDCTLPAREDLPAIQSFLNVTFQAMSDNTAKIPCYSGAPLFSP